jgi:hypothetical protein
MTPETRRMDRKARAGDFPLSARPAVFRGMPDQSLLKITVQLLTSLK